MRALALVASVTFLSLVALPAKADDIDTCANAYESAQRLHQKGDAKALVEAQACARDACPDVLRKECASWVKEWTPAEKAASKSSDTPPPPSRDASEPEPAKAATETARPIPFLAYALGGGGILALGVAGGFALDGLSQRNDLERSGCEPACGTDKVESAKTSFLVADVMALTGLVALGGAFVVYLTRPERTERVTSRSRINVTPVLGLAAAGVRGTF